MNSVFTKVEPDLLPVLDELRRREPIFHTAEFGSTTAEFERSTAPDYWEVGASGRRYSREFILAWAEGAPDHFVDAKEAGWRTEDFGLRRLGSDTYLLTYTLDQAGRRTRRATIWQKSEVGWRILYHQGTIIAAGEDDSFSS
ncbi:MAG: DUF4440 domain-containing protein [Terracidiphilus sp.]|jgi:hypothetical protein